MNIYTIREFNCQQVYHSRKKYPLEIDNRFSQQWKGLCNTLQEASKLITQNEQPNQ